MTNLILLRHGKSAWNEQNLFTGWVDIPLSEKGVKESLDAGKAIRDLPIDAIYTSTLVRCHMTVGLSLLHHASGKVPVFLHPGEAKREEWATIYSEEAKKKTLPVHIAWELNERMYGRLQGCNKEEMAKKFGAEQVHTWRRSFDVAPPEGESLAMTAERTLPYFQKNILPRLKNKENLLVCAHGNSLRAIVMHLDGLSHEEVLQLELETGVPLVYRFEGNRHERIDLFR